MKNQKLHSIIKTIQSHRIIAIAIVFVLIGLSGTTFALQRRNTNQTGNVKGTSVNIARSTNPDQPETQDTKEATGTTTPTSQPTTQTTGSVSNTAANRGTTNRTTQPASSAKPNGTALPAATLTPLPSGTTTPTPTPAPTSIPRTILGGSEVVEILLANTEAVGYGDFSTSDGSNVYWQPMYKNTYWPGNEPSFDGDPATMPDSFVYMETPPNTATNTLGYTIVYTGGSIVTGSPWHEFAVMAIDPLTDQPISAVSVRYNFQ